MISALFPVGWTSVLKWWWTATWVQWYWNVKKIYVKYQITIIFCALCSCCQENLAYFAIKVRQLWVDTSRLSSLPLSGVIVCSLLWFAAVVLEVGRMLNLWICSVCDPFLVQCSIESREALAPFLLQPPRRVCREGNQQWCFCRRWRSSCALPLPASPSLSGEVRVLFTSWQGQRCAWSCSTLSGLRQSGCALEPTCKCVGTSCSSKFKYLGTSNSSKPK